MPPKTDSLLLTTSEQLVALVQELSKAPILSVDTESNGLHAFREQVCLVQFSTAEKDYLVDPIAIDDLSPLAPLFNNPKIEKIFHAADYDLIVLQRDYGYRFANLFDTMIAARILGIKKVGLGNLLESEIKVKLAKGYQKADWGKRPLRPEMLDYASMDTHHLIALRNHLKKKLHEKGRWDIAAEDFARLPKTIPNPESINDGDIWRIKGARDLQPQERAILSKLADYRKGRAEKADLPLFKIMGNRTLTAIAAAGPRNENDLQQIEGMSPGQIRRHGRALLQAVQAGSRAEPIQRPKRGSYDEDLVDRLETLRNWRKLAGRKMEVESDVILPRDVMESIARQNPKDSGSLKEIMVDLPWRLDRYGNDILSTLNNH
jgi:ribonuclease D